VLDYELKRDYQTFLNRADRPEGVDHEDDLKTFAAAARLPIVDGHLELPDLRIEYETPDGRLEYRDVELVTEHYSRSQLAGKSAAGFALYRAAGAGRPAAKVAVVAARRSTAPSGAPLMTLENRAQALESLGFTARQARFLAAVALHSGYCLRRHTCFAGLQCELVTS
jgi:hypothetical protein